MLLSTSAHLIRRDRSGLPRGLSGTPVSQYWLGAPASYYDPGVQQAKALGYSVPIAAGPLAAGGAIVTYVNPDGTLGQIIKWQQWPLVPVNSDPAFIPPPNQATWGGYMTALNTGNYANAANEAVAIQQNPTGTVSQQIVTDPNTGITSTVSNATACGSSSFSIAGSCIPFWTIGIGVAVFLFSGKGRR